MWENFEALARGGRPALHRIPGTPLVDLFSDEGGGRIGLRVLTAAEGDPPASPLDAVTIERAPVNSVPHLIVTTRAASLFREFYAFALTVADRIQLDGLPAIAAIADSLATWKDLLRPVELLSLDQQLGLRGELWVLTRVLRTAGAAGIHAWVGPLSEPHDFRMGDLELEVKATRDVHRVHMISSLAQLVPSTGRNLYIVSLQFEPAGAEQGTTLPEEVKRLRDCLGGAQSERALFEDLLRRYGYVESRAAHYTARMIQRTVAAIVPVDERCPRLVPDDMRLLGGERVVRITDVHYRANLEGLGILDGTPEFLAVLP